MTIEIFDQGNVIKCRATFENEETGAKVDPTSVVFRFEDPSDNVTVYTYGVDSEVVRESEGIYYVDMPVDEGGTWWVRVESTGTGQAAEQDCFFVDESHFA